MMSPCPCLNKLTMSKCACLSGGSVTCITIADSEDAFPVRPLKTLGCFWPISDSNTPEIHPTTGFKYILIVMWAVLCVGSVRLASCG